MILYQFPGGDRVGSISAPCLKVEMALRLAGADYETRLLRKRGEVRRISRTGRLPVLEIDGERVVDSVAILDRLEKAFPDARLSPRDPQRRVRDRLWEHFATDSMYWCGYYLRWVRPDTRDGFFDALFRNAPATMRWVARRLVIPQQLRRAMVHGSGGKSAEAVDAELDRSLDMIETGLEGGPFLQGRERPARGDLALTSLLVQAGFRETLIELRDRILARPALVAHAGRVMDACTMKRTRWLEGC